MSWLLWKRILNKFKWIRLSRYWWKKIQALGAARDWVELEKFSKSKKSPIGYEVWKRSYAKIKIYLRFNSLTGLVLLFANLLFVIHPTGSAHSHCKYLSWEGFALFSTDNPFEMSLSISLLLQNLLLLVERVSLCSLQIIALK